MLNCIMKEQTLELEIFPDELFIELFSYMKPIDLYTGFLNLNSRINTILHDIQININIIDNNQYEQYKQCMNYFANQITYLAIDCHWSCLLHHLSLRPFRNLRSLHLPMPSDQQCEEIQPEYLLYLNYLTTNHKVFQMILSHSSEFSNLRICHIPRIYPSIITQINSSQLCFTLQTLNLYSCSMNNLFHILQYVPNLKYLQVMLTPTKWNIPDFDMKHENILHLKIKLQQLKPDFEILLKSMPNISQLEFIWHEDIVSTSDFDFKTLFDILNQYSASFKYVHLDLYFTYGYNFVGRIQSFDLEHFLGTTCTYYSSKRKNDENNTLFKSKYITQRNKRINQAKS